MTYIDNKLFTYIQHKSDLTTEIAQRYKNSLIFIGDKQQIYNPLTNTYIGILSTYTTYASYLQVEPKNIGTHNIIFGNDNSYTSAYINGNLKYDARDNILYCPNFNGTYFEGDLIGTATNASYIKVETKNTSRTYYLTFIYNNANGNKSAYINTALKYIPSQNVTYTTADQSAKTLINNTSSNFTYFLTFVNESSGQRYSYVNSDLYYNPYQKTLTVSNLEGTATNASYFKVSEGKNGSYNLVFSSANSGNASAYVSGNLKYDYTNAILYSPNFNGDFYGNLIGNADTSDASIYTSYASYLQTYEKNKGSYYITFGNKSSYNNAYISQYLKYNAGTNTLETSIIKANTKFIGDLEGNALTADFAEISTYTTYASYLQVEPKNIGIYNIIFGNDNSYTSAYVNGNLKYNAETCTLESTIIKANTKFIGNLEGTSTNATNVNILDKSTNTATYYLGFYNNVSGNRRTCTDEDLYYIPSTNTLNVYNLSKESKIYVQKKSSNNSYYIPFYDEYSEGNKISYINNNLYYNPSTKTLTVSNLNGIANESINTSCFKVSEGKNGSYNVVLSSANSGNASAYISSNLNYDYTNNILSTIYFKGDLIGTAYNASYIKVEQKNTNKSYYITFIYNNTDGNKSAYINTALKYIPSQNVTYTIADQSAKTLITNTNTNKSYYLTFVNDSNNGQRYSYVNSNLYYNPFTNILTVSNIDGTVSNADKLNIINTDTDQSYYITFVNNNENDSYAYVNSNIRYNPNVNTLTLGNVVPLSNLNYSIGNSIYRFNSIYGKWFSGISQYCEVGLDNTSKFYIVGSTGSKSSSTNDLSNRKLKYDDKIYVTSDYGRLHVDSLLVNYDSMPVDGTSVNIKGHVRIHNGNLHIEDSSYTDLSYANGFHHNQHDSNDYVILAGGGTKPISEFASAVDQSNLDQIFLKLAGGVMTGAIKRYYDSNSTDPMICLTSANINSYLWRINHNTNGSPITTPYMGFSLLYEGKNSGNTNNLVLYSDNQNNGAVPAIKINQDGTTYLGARCSYVNNSLVLTEENIRSILDINQNKIGVKINSYTSPYITIPYAINSSYSSYSIYSSYLKVDSKEKGIYNIIFGNDNSYTSAYINGNLMYDAETCTLFGVNGNFNGQITSTVANGTSPLVVNSKTKVQNLYAEYAQKINPLYEAEFDYTSTANNNNNNIAFFGNIIPISDYTKPWSIKYRLYVDLNSNTESTNKICQGYYDCTIYGSGTTMEYKSFNTFYSTSYRPIYYHIVAYYYTTGTGSNQKTWQEKYDNRSTNPIKIGCSTTNAYSPTTKRHYRIEVYELINCEFSFVSSMESFESVYTTDKYGNYSQFGVTTQGLDESGDANDTTSLYLYYSQLTAGTNGISRYSLIMLDNNNKWQSFTKGSGGTNTDKLKNDVGFKLGSRIYYVNKSTDTAADTKLGNNTIMAYKTLIDFRYSLNINTTANGLSNNLEPYKPLYIVGHISNNLFYLEDTWWTQTEPIEEDGKIYIRITESVYPDYTDKRCYRGDLISDGYAFWFKNGKFVRYYIDNSWSNIIDKPNDKSVWGQKYIDSNGDFKDVNGVLNITGTSNYSEGIRIHHYSGLSSLWFGATDNSGYQSDMWGISVNSNGMRFRGPASASATSPTDYINIIPGGYVGIGTTSPTQKLHVKGTSYFELGSNQYIYLNNKLTINRDGKIYPYDTNVRSSGLYGNYDSHLLSHIWSIGSNYKISDDGTSPLNVYGLLYFHTNWSNNAQYNIDNETKTPLGTFAEGHQIGLFADGILQASLGNYIWSKNGFKKYNSSNSYVLLGGGGHKQISDFATTNHTHDDRYVTLATDQTITGNKTFNSNIIMGTSHYIYGKNESNGAMLQFDGSRTIVGSAGTTSTKATHIRSKTGHATIGTSTTAQYTIIDTGNVSPSISNGTSSNTIKITVGTVDSLDYTVPFATN